MILAAVFYYETHLQHRHLNTFFLGSVLSAFVIGVMEQSNMTTIILTNVPLCLSFGVLMDLLIHKSIATKSDSKAEGTSYQRLLEKEKDTMILV